MLRIGTGEDAPRVSALSISYKTGASEGDPPARYEVTGSIAGHGIDADVAIGCVAGPGGVLRGSITSRPPPATGLKLSGLLSLFGLTTPTVATPSGVSGVFDVGIVRVEATFATNGGLSLTTFGATGKLTAGAFGILSPGSGSGAGPRVR